MSKSGFSIGISLQTLEGKLHITYNDAVIHDLDVTIDILKSIGISIDYDKVLGQNNCDVSKVYDLTVKALTLTLDKSIGDFINRSVLDQNATIRFRLTSMLHDTGIVTPRISDVDNTLAHHFYWYNLFIKLPFTGWSDQLGDMNWVLAVAFGCCFADWYWDALDYENNESLIFISQPWLDTTVLMRRVAKSQYPAETLNTREEALTFLKGEISDTAQAKERHAEDMPALYRFIIYSSYGFTTTTILILIVIFIVIYVKH